MSRIELRVKRLPHGADLPLPAYQSEFAAGLDLVAAVPAETPVVIAAGERAMIPTGIAIALPPGTEGQIRPRNQRPAGEPGLQFIHSRARNAHCTIGYRGHIAS